MIKRLISLLLLLFILLSNNVLAKKKNQNELSGEDYALAYLLSLSKKGLIACQATEPKSSMLVEPLFWKNLLHKDKILLLQAAFAFLCKMQ